MSLYNMLMSRNPHGPYLMASLGFVQGAEQNQWLGRFRDVYTNNEADRIFVLHRNYGEDNEFNELIKQHPNYLAYTPDVTDFTYGVWEFSVPEEFKSMVLKIASLSDNIPAMDCYRKLLKDMENGVKNEATENAMQAGVKIVENLQKVMQKEVDGAEIKHGDGTVVIGNLHEKN